MGNVVARLQHPKTLETLQRRKGITQLPGSYRAVHSSKALRKDLGRLEGEWTAAMAPSVALVEGTRKSRRSCPKICWIWCLGLTLFLCHPWILILFKSKTIHLTLHCDLLVSWDSSLVRNRPRNSIAGCYSALPWCCKQRSTRSWCLALHVAIGGGQAIQRTPVNLVEFGRYDIREFTGVLSNPKWCRVFSKRDYELLAAIRLSWKFLTWAWRISNQQIDSFAGVVTHQERSLHNEVQDVRSEKSFSSMVGVMYRVDVGLSFK